MGECFTQNWFGPDKIWIWTTCNPKIWFINISVPTYNNFFIIVRFILRFCDGFDTLYFKLVERFIPFSNSIHISHLRCYLRNLCELFTSHHNLSLPASLFLGYWLLLSLYLLFSWLLSWFLRGSAYHDIEKLFMRLLFSLEISQRFSGLCFRLHRLWFLRFLLGLFFGRRGRKSRCKKDSTKMGTDLRSINCGLIMFRLFFEPNKSFRLWFKFALLFFREFFFQLLKSFRYLFFGMRRKLFLRT